MSHGGASASPAEIKVTYLLGELAKVEGDESREGKTRKVALGLQLHKSTEGAPVDTSPTSPAPTEKASARLHDADGKEITTAMVGKADLDQLKAWAQLDAEWDNDVMALVQERLEALRQASSPPSGSTPVSSPAGTGASQQPQPVKEPPSPEQLFAASVSGHQLKKSLMDLHRVNPALAEAVRDAYQSSSNPSLPEALLVRLAEANLLWRDRNKYRESTGGQNGMIYKFYVSSNSGPSVGEWHVHWESRGRAGDPGWKRGKQGEKSGGDNVAQMKKLLGSDWGEVVGAGGRRVPASQ